jgi:hypothetical protein
VTLWRNWPCPENPLLAAFLGAARKRPALLFGRVYGASL